MRHALDPHLPKILQGELHPALIKMSGRRQPSPG